MIVLAQSHSCQKPFSVSHSSKDEENKVLMGLWPSS